MRISKDIQILAIRATTFEIDLRRFGSSVQDSQRGNGQGAERG